MLDARTDLEIAGPSGEVLVTPVMKSNSVGASTNPPMRVESVKKLTSIGMLSSRPRMSTSRWPP